MPKLEPDQQETEGIMQNIYQNYNELKMSFKNIGYKIDEQQQRDLKAIFKILRPEDGASPIPNEKILTTYDVLNIALLVYLSGKKYTGIRGLKINFQSYHLY